MPEMCGEIPNVIEESIFDVKEGILMAQSSIVNIGNAPQLPAYLAQPEGKGPFPAVVVIFEAFGLNENIKDITRRKSESSRMDRWRRSSLSPTPCPTTGPWPT